jgi:hypothetical protein
MYSAAEINSYNTTETFISAGKNPYEKVYAFELAILNRNNSPLLLKEGKKLDSLAAFYREEGNEAYKVRNHSIALLFYNKSLCYSSKESGNLPLAYASKYFI